MEKNAGILFTHTYFMRYDPKQWALGLPYPPLGTLYAASLMRENGYAVSFFDTQFCTLPEEILPSLKQTAPAFFVIYDDGFNYLTKMCLTNMREAAFKLCQLAKQDGCTVIIASSDSTDRYAEYLTQGADYVIIGEGELTLLELIGSVTNGDDPRLVRGVAWLENGSAHASPGRPVLKDLDSLPIPAWDLVDIEPYRESWQKNAGYFSLNMNTTRGCPFKCNWCAKPIYGNRYNSRSPENVLREINLLKENYR